MYSFLIEGKDKPVEKHRAKGIKRGAAREIRHEHYKEQLDRPAENYLANHRIGTKLHRLYTIEVREWNSKEKFLFFKDNVIL